MFKAVIVLSVILCSSLRFSESQSDSCSPLPADAPGIPIDPARMMGTWYQLLENTGWPENNVIVSLKSLGSVTIPQYDGGALAVNWTAPVILDGKCVGVFAQANFTAEGKKYATLWLPGTTTQVSTVYTTLYTDYDTMEVSTRCQTPNMDTDICPDPVFWVFTRHDPLTMASDDLDAIVNTANQYLASFCYNVTMLAVSGWNNTVPACSPTAPPEFTALIRGIQQANPDNQDFAVDGQDVADSVLYWIIKSATQILIALRAILNTT